LFEKGDARGVPAASADKLRDMLLAVHTAGTVTDVDVIPGWKLHPLKGRLAGYRSLAVTGNWRLLFRFENGDAFDLDLLDYH
jgi:proteic killer suppression protein